MDISQYTELTGIEVPTSKKNLVIAQLNRSQRVLENMLGFTLDPDLINENKYVESGKTQTDCPTPDDNLTLDAADAVVYAYRQFPYNKKDKYLCIDPASQIHSVKLVKDNVTYKTFETEDFRTVNKNEVIQYLELCTDYCECICETICSCHQLAVDATWLWEDGCIPEELLYLHADMATYYSDNKSGLKSETIGPHSYTKFDKGAPETRSENMSVIKKYAGPLGSVKKTLTV